MTGHLEALLNGRKAPLEKAAAALYANTGMREVAELLASGRVAEASAHLGKVRSVVREMLGIAGDLP